MTIEMRLKMAFVHQHVSPAILAAALSLTNAANPAPKPDSCSLRSEFDGDVAMVGAVVPSSDVAAVVGVADGAARAVVIRLPPPPPPPPPLFSLNPPPPAVERGVDATGPSLLTRVRAPLRGVSPGQEHVRQHTELELSMIL